MVIYISALVNGHWNISSFPLLLHFTVLLAFIKRELNVRNQLVDALDHLTTRSYYREVLNTGASRHYRKSAIWRISTALPNVIIRQSVKKNFGVAPVQYQYTCQIFGKTFGKNLHSAIASLKSAKWIIWSGTIDRPIFSVWGPCSILLDTQHWNIFSFHLPLHFTMLIAFLRGNSTFKGSLKSYKVG